MFLARIPKSRDYADTIIYRNSASFESRALTTEEIFMTGLGCSSPFIRMIATALDLECISDKPLLILISVRFCR